MKLIKLILIVVVIMFVACEKFETKEQADIFYHIEAGDTEIPVWIRGNTRSGKFVIFINGGPGLTSLDIARADMLGWAEGFEKELAMVYYDQRGTGNAQGNIDAKSITKEQYIIDLKWIVQSIKAQYSQAEVFLMGHSFGGFIGQNFLLNPENQALISGWINVNGSTVVDIDKEWGYRLQFLEELAMEKMSEDSVKWTRALDWAKDNNPIVNAEQKRQWREFIGHAGMGVIPEEDVNIEAGGILSIVFASSYNIFPSYLSSNLSKVGELLYEDIKGTDLLPQLNKIKLPVLTLWGKYDDIIPPQLGKTAFDFLGTPSVNKTFVLFNESGHQPFINEAEKFEAEVIKFVYEY